MMVHHTGSDRATAASIATGRPDLAGPLSQLHIARDGTVTVVAAGVAWHAGVGMYPWVPANMGNWHLIGIECANSGTSPSAPHRRNWPDAQYFALVRSSQRSTGTWGRRRRAPSGTRSTQAGPKASGIPVPSTWTVLRGDISGQIAADFAAARPPRPPVPVGEYTDILLHRGSTGPQVAELQRRLEDGSMPAYAGDLVVDGGVRRGDRTRRCANFSAVSVDSRPTGSSARRRAAAPAAPDRLIRECW